MSNIIDSICIANFRNIKGLKLEFDKKIIALEGRNGSGKTTVLEAISLFSPGKNLRSSKLLDIVNNQNPGLNWSTNIKSNIFGILEAEFKNGKKQLTLNDKKISSLDRLSIELPIIWITNHMIAYLTHNAQLLRSFFDKLLFLFDPKFLNTFIRYKKFLKDWTALVLNGSKNDRWAYELEKIISQCSIEIMAKRRNIINSLNENLLKFSGIGVDIAMTGEIEKIYEQNGELSSSAIIAKMHRCKEDCNFRFLSFGIHRTKFIIRNSQALLNISSMSYGEQKLIFLNIILSFLEVMKKNNKKLPLLLLDEILSGMDNSFSSFVFREIEKSKLQVIMSAEENVSKFGNQELVGRFDISELATYYDS